MSPYFVIVLVAVLALWPDVSQAKKKTRLPALDWGLRVGVNAVYNDNVLRLSGPDQAAFRRGEPTFRSPLESVDDGEGELSIAPTLIWRAPSNLMVSANYRFKNVSRANNDFTNYQTHGLSASIRPRVKGYKWAAKLGAFTIPSFYLRVYRDRDYGTHDDARFTSSEYSGEFSYRPAESLLLTALAGWGSNYYGEKFTEFDTESKEFGLDVLCATPWKPAVSARYVRRLSTNVGKDQAFTPTPSFDSGQIVEDNEYGDGDNNEDEFRFGLRSPIRVTKSLVVDGAINSKLRRRVYTTDNSLVSDPFHRGRLDNRWEITPSLSWGITSSLEMDTYFTYEQRTSTSDVPGVAQVKDFVRREFGVGLSYKIN